MPFLYAVSNGERTVGESGGAARIRVKWDCSLSFRIDLERLLSFPWKGKNGCYAYFFYFKWTQAARKAFRQDVVHLARGPGSAAFNALLAGPNLPVAWISVRVLGVPTWSWPLIATLTRRCASVHKMPRACWRKVPLDANKAVWGWTLREKFWTWDVLVCACQSPHLSGPVTWLVLE